MRRIIESLRTPSPRRAFRRAPLAAALLAAGLLLTGCSAGLAGSASDDSLAPGPEIGGVADGGSFDTSLESGGDAAASDVDQAARDLIVTGWMTITADDPLAAANDAVTIVERAGGRIDARQEYAPTDYDNGSASLTLRIPAAQLDAVLDDLRELGRVDDLSTQSTDVTVQRQDLEARISALRASVARLEGLLAQANDISDLIELESALSQRQAELEGLEAQQRGLADQIDMSTIQLSLRSEQSAPATVPGDFLSGLTAGWNGFVAFWAGFLVVLGVLLPWLVTAAIVTAAIIVLVRWRRARRASAAPADAAAGAAPEELVDTK